MSKRIYIIIGAVVIALGLAVLLLRNVAVFYSEDYAISLARSKLDEFAERKHLDKNLFIGPNFVELNKKWSFDWDYTGEPPMTVGVWIDNSGHIELYYEDK